MRSCIYAGIVSHKRSAPVRHVFRYPLVVFYLDLDELIELDRSIPGFAVNRRGLVSFHDRDHLDGRAVSTRDRLLAFLQTQGIDLAGGKILLLTQCRILGYVFNPVSFYFCHGTQGALRCVVAEVNNTFGERHLYVLSNRQNLEPGREEHAAYRAAKVMHVSPFVSMDAVYDFDFAPIGDRLSITIRESEAGVHFFDAHLRGRRMPFTGRSLARVLFRYPLLTLRVIAAIHWEALRLYIKGAPFHRQPTPSNEQLAQLRLWQRVGEEVAR
jgi:DUF1365 family protein